MIDESTTLAHLVEHGFVEPDVPSESIINTCVRCGLCLPHCPTYLEVNIETSSPRGRIHLMQAVSEGRLDVTSPGFVEQMYQCLDCRACEAVCPSGVEYGQIVEDARTQIERAQVRPLWQRALRVAVFDYFFANMSAVRVASSFLRFYQQSGIQGLARNSGLLRVLGLEKLERLLPRLSERFFVPRGQYWSALTGQTESGHRRVAMFAGCIMSTAFAETDRATVRVLRRNGCDVVAPAGQGCCGALTIHAGEKERARALARINIAAFEPLAMDALIINAAGCGTALKEYEHLLQDDPAYRERAKRFSAKVKDISEFLATRDLNPNLGELSTRVTYQEPCHLAHGQRITRQPRTLLQAIPGVTFVEMNESALCCGSAGVYNVTRPEMSQQLLSRKMENALETRAGIIASANPGCILQLQSGVRQAGERAEGIEVKHVVDLLDQSYCLSERDQEAIQPAEEPGNASAQAKSWVLVALALLLTFILLRGNRKGNRRLK